MSDTVQTLRLRYLLADLDKAEARFQDLGVPFMVLGADGLGRSDGLDPCLGEVVLWPEDGQAAAELIERSRAGLPPLVSWDRAALEDVDWVKHWRRYFHWTTVSPTLAVGPPWEPSPSGAEVAILIVPGEAFGTGTHPTTRLSLGLLEEELAERAAEVAAPSVLDVGCGSGVLCVAARLMGAGEVLGLDVEEPALDECARNALLNEAPFRACLAPVAEIEGAWDLVVANILSNVLVAIAPDLAARVSPGGALILSGVPEVERGFAERFIEAAGTALRVDKTRCLEGWWAGRFLREVIS